MAVIEAMMVLYAKEVVTPDGAVAAVQRFTQSLRPEPLPLDHEDAMLLWINKACSALKKKIEQELIAMEEQGGVIKAKHTRLSNCLFEGQLCFHS